MKLIVFQSLIGTLQTVTDTESEKLIEKFQSLIGTLQTGLI